MKIRFNIFRKKEPAFREAYLELSKYRNNLQSVMWRIRVKIEAFSIKAERSRGQEEKEIYRKEVAVLTQLYQLVNKLDALLLRIILRLDSYQDLAGVLESFKETRMAISKLRPELEALNEAYGAIFEQLSDATHYFETITINGQTIQLPSADVDAESILEEAIDRSIELERAEEELRSVLLKAARDGEYVEAI
ncbi:MAG: hypothetical protein ACP5LW_05995 [Nitrososphaeria archaeon]